MSIHVLVIDGTVTETAPNGMAHTYPVIREVEGVVNLSARDEAGWRFRLSDGGSVEYPAHRIYSITHDPRPIT